MTPHSLTTSVFSIHRLYSTTSARHTSSLPGEVISGFFGYAYMAESNFSTPLHNPFSMPTPTSPHAQGSQTPAPPVFQPGFPDYSTWYADYHHFPPSQFGAQMPDQPQGHSGPLHYLHQTRTSQYHQFSGAVGNRSAGYYPTPTDIFPRGPAPIPGQGPAPGQFHSMHMSSGPHSDFRENRNNTDHLPMIEPTMPNGAHGYNLPPYSQLSQSQMHGFNPFQGRRPGPALPNLPSPPSGRFSGDAMQSTIQGRGPMRGITHGSSDTPRVVSPPSRRTSYERQHPHLQAPGGPDRRPQPFLGTHTRRSDRSVSPRTSHRRSFDRYATDLPHSSGSSDAEEAATRARVHRVRQQRQRAMLGGPEFRRAYVSVDSNSPTPAQMQALKDKLRHFLPSELPEGSSASCDICQKDYSAKHVLPTEEDEVAIQLPCKHVFGEYCIHKWFDTCKQHKNKITCPMCRKLLVEPVQRNLLHATEVMAFFSRSLDQGSLSQLSPADRQVLERVMGPMEGDFSHS